MKRSSLFVKVIFIAGWLSCCVLDGQITAPVADQISPVAGAGHDYIHMLNETVNPQVGSVSLRISVPGAPGRHLAVPFSFAYDSNGTHHGMGWQDNLGYFGTNGWSYELPTLTFSYGNVVGPQDAGEGPVGPQIGCNYYTGFMFEDSSGTTHALKLTSLDKTVDCASVNYWMDQYLTGGDASVMATTSTLTYAQQAPQPVTVSDNDGTVYYFALDHSFGAGPSTEIAIPDWIEDRNGNIVTFNTSGNGMVTITDSMGRTALTVNGFGSSGNTVTVSGLGTYTVQWAPQTWSATYNVQEIPPPGEPAQAPYMLCTGSFGQKYFTPGTVSATSSPSNAQSPNMITQITLPNGQSYQMQYDPVYGLLSKVIYPDGAYSRYVWTTNPMAMSDMSGANNGSSTNPPAGCEAKYDEPAVAQKFTSFDGKTEVLEQDYTYAPTQWASANGPYQQWTNKQTTVTTKDLVQGTSFKTVYNYLPVAVDPTGRNLPAYTDGIVPVNPAESSILTYDSNGNLIKSVNKSYLDYWANPEDEKDTLDNGQMMEVKRCYETSYSSGCPAWTGDPFGKGDILTDEWTYDYGIANSGTAGALLKHVHADYNTFSTPLYTNTPSILDRAKDIITYDGSGNRVAESDFCFDGDTTAFSGCAQSSLQPASAIQHDETNFPAGSVSGRGNVTTAIARCFVGSSACSQGDSIAKYTWDETGQMLAKTDANGNTTHYSFTDNFDSSPGSIPATYSTGSVTIGGSEESTTVGAQNTTEWDAGNVSITVNGQAFTVSYGQGSSAYGIAQALVAAINGGSSYVTATQNGTAVHLQAKQAGATTYSLSASVSSSQPGLFNPPSFSATASGSSVVGGTGSVGPSGTNGYLTGITDALNHTAGFQYAFGDGQVIQTTGENSEKTNFSYNDPLRRLKETDAPDGGQALLTYNEASYPPNVVTQKKLDSSRYVTSTAVLDGSTHVTEAQLNSEPDSGGAVDKTDTAYDGLGRGYSGTNPYRSTTDPTYASSTTQFDALGRAVTLTRQDNSVVTTTYSGNTTTVTDEAGNQRRSVTNALGELVEVDEPGDNYPATPATAQPQVTGTLRSIAVGSSAATYATGSFTISGNEPCNQMYGCEQGAVSVSVSGGASTSVSYGSGSTANGIAQALATQLNGSVVSATVSGSTIYLTSKTAGTAGNYSLSGSSSGGGAVFNGPAFTVSASGSTMTGGTNAVAGTTVYDYGTASVTVGSWTSPTVPYGSNGANAGNNTASLVATALASVLNGASSPVTANVVNGDQLAIVCKTVGTVCNGESVSIASTTSYTQYFSGGSFSGQSVLLGGGGPAEASSLAIPFVTLYKYDALGNLLCVEQHGDASSGTGCGSYPNPTAGDSWRPRMFTYDSMGHLLTAYNPETGTIAYTYDKDGNVVTKTDARGIAIAYSYDALNRVTGETFSNGDPAITYTYDQGANGIGHRTGMTDASGSTSWTYDVMGRVASESRTIAGVTKAISYTYNLAGGIASITYPSGATVAYASDNAGRELSAIDSQNGFNYVQNATYAPNGKVASYLLGQSTLFSGYTETYLYNTRLQICREMLSSTGVAPSSCTDATHFGNVMDFQYDFHLGNQDNGNLYTAANNIDSTRTQTFTYDTLNRLVTAQNAGTDCSVMALNGQTKFWGDSFSYDAWGNLLDKTPKKCSPESFTASVSANNELIGQYGYDAAGNMTNNGPNTYAYNGESELVSAGGYTYVYDGDGNRVEKCTQGTAPGTCAANPTGTLYWYGAPGIVAETDLNGNMQSEYIFFNGSRIARKDGTALPYSVFYYFGNQIGSAAIIADGSGNVQDDSDYYAWGGTVLFKDNVSNNYWFTSKLRDQETGLDYFGARYYGNTFGRFTQPDWSAKATGVPYADFKDPQSLNLYGYVRDNPIIRIDPDGHCGDSGSTADWLCRQGFNENGGRMTDQELAWNNVTLGESPGNLSLTYVSNARSGTDQNGNPTFSNDVAQAQFSTKKGEEGKFLGFDESTITTTKDKDTGKVTSTTTHVASGGLKEANAFFGYDSVSDAVDAAAQVRAPGFGAFVKQDVKEHPWRTSGRALQVIGYTAALAEPPTTAWGYVGLTTLFGGTAVDLGNQAWPDAP